MKEKLQEYALIAEIISAAVIFVSLIYVGIQVNASASAVRAASLNDANNAVQSWYQQLGSSQQTSETWYRAMISESALPDAEEFQFLMMTHAAFVAFQNSYLLAAEGTIANELREAVITNSILGVKHLPGFDRYWRQRKGYLHRDFVTYVESLLSRESVKDMDLYNIQEPVR